jgi:hypothetical protein
VLRSSFTISEKMCWLKRTRSSFIKDASSVKNETTKSRAARYSGTRQWSLLSSNGIYIAWIKTGNISIAATLNRQSIKACSVVLK